MQNEKMLDLYPRNWQEFIGKEQVKQLLQRMLEAAERRGEKLEPILLFGPAGCGKTALARLLAKRRDFAEIPCPLVSENVFLVRLFANRKRKIVILDEIQALKRESQEALHRILDNGIIEIGLKYKFKPTLIACTTRISELTLPLRSRFVEIWVGPYSPEEIAGIAGLAAKRIKFGINEAAARLIAQFARGIPRYALRILLHARDFSESSIISEESVRRALSSLGYDTWGLLPQEQAYIKALAELGCQTGIKNIAKRMGLRVKEIDLVEAYPLSRGLVEISGRGRRLTLRGLMYVEEQVIPHEERAEEAL